MANKTRKTTRIKQYKCSNLTSTSVGLLIETNRAVNDQVAVDFKFCMKKIVGCIEDSQARPRQLNPG